MAIDRWADVVSAIEEIEEFAADPRQVVKLNVDQYAKFMEALGKARAFSLIWFASEP